MTEHTSPRQTCRACLNALHALDPEPVDEPQSSKCVHCAGPNPIVCNRCYGMVAYAPFHNPVGAKLHELSENLERLQKERDELKGALHAQYDRELQAGERCDVSAEAWGCDWPNAVAEKVLAQRSQLQSQAEKLEGLRERLQRFYDVSTWLLSACPSARLDKGATQPYHDSLNAVIVVRDELRRDDLIQHNEEWWNFHLKKASALLSEAPSDNGLLDYSRILELLAEHGIEETDHLKHVLEDYDRWNAEKRSALGLLSEAPSGLQTEKDKT